MDEFVFKRAPLSHQVDGLDRSADAEAFALFYEQRCGKTKVILDTAAYQFSRGTIDALVVIAWPAGVHRVWVDDECPKDLRSDLPYRALAWRSGRMEGREAEASLTALLNFKGLAILTMNCEAMTTRAAERYLTKFFKRRRLMLVADESSWMKSPGAIRTRRMRALGRHPNVIMRRVLDGTPADESPLDLYEPCAFLDQNLLGFPTFFGFRLHYTKLEKGYAPGGRTFQRVSGYRNLDELSDRLSTFSHRVLRREVSDAPEKIYQKRFFTLTERQRIAYDRLRDEFLTELSTGETMPVVHVLTRLTKLQMIARGYQPPIRLGTPCPFCSRTGDDCLGCSGLGVIVDEIPLTRIDPDRNPAIETFSDELAMRPGPTVVWCRFRQDVDDCLTAALASGRRAARFDGTVSMEDRRYAYDGFRGGQIDLLVATVGSALSRGHDLSTADLLVYYSNDPSLRNRRQSEDRAEGLSRVRSTGIVDLVAEDTIDERWIDALRDKRSLAEMVLHDPVTNWI